MFWILAGLLTLAASLAVLLPLTVRGGRDEAGDAPDLAVYRDQLAEVERDKGRGLISAEAAEEARAEIGRRILRLGGRAGTGGGAGHAGWHRWVTAAAVLFVPLTSWGVYSVLGSPDLPPQPLSARLEKTPGESTMEELLARAEVHLKVDPTDGRGWSVLAPVYLRLGRFDEAAEAYRNASRYAGATADREAGLGEAIAGAAGGAINGDARAAFERALKLDPGNAVARFQLAAAEAQGGRTAEALAAWNAMLPGLPADSPWRAVIAQAVASVERPAPGPDAGKVAEAEAMPQGDRATMIEGMVAGLDAKLRDNPRDPDGWMRLVRSYMVLDRPEEARGALERGREALGTDSDEGRRLTALADSLGLGEAVRQ